MAPRLTVSVEGLKARLLIVTIFSTASLPAEVEDELGLGLVVELQPAIITNVTITAANTTRVSFFIIFLRASHVCDTCACLALYLLAYLISLVRGIHQLNSFAPYL